MSAGRTLIRQAVRAKLLNTTGAGPRVYPTRVLSLRRLELPAVAIYTLEESVDASSATTAPRELTRDLSLVIEGWVAPGACVDDAMDLLAQQIETAMHADPYLDDKAADSILDSTSMEAIEEGDRMLGVVTLTYAVTYRTLAPEPPDELDDFRVADVTHDLGGAVHEDEQAHDVIVVQDPPPDPDPPEEP